jgi:hypothetical protein
MCLFRRFFFIGVVVLLLIQLLPSGRSNPPVVPAHTIEQTLTVPADVKVILDRSCRNCHSNETVWPWYAHVAPVSWLMVGDVNAAREDMNLSEWGEANADAQRDTLLEVCRQVKKGAMPLSSYRLLHREAALSAADVTTLCNWSEQARKDLKARE